MELFEPEYGSAFWLYVGIFLAIYLGIMVAFLLTQQNTLKAVQPQNRAMKPGQVWLQLIPIFNLFWQFVVVKDIARSIGRELNTHDFSFEAEHTPAVAGVNEKPTQGIGIAYCTLFILSSLLGAFATLPGVACWIIYWVKLSQYKSRLQARLFERGLASDPTV
ncbi:MAG: DUF4328 domain-containing protein [Chitinophagaceae bacterium]|nr:MAG: DUF4328 domain-containing protein [Chitinophagaceae bacterium]